MANKLLIQYECQDDRHWQEPYPDTATSLKDSGYKKRNKAPKHFVPNLRKLIETDSLKSLTELGTIIRDWNPSQLRILIKVLSDQKTLMELGFQLGQPVFWRSIGAHLPNYLDQWHQCYVLSISQHNDDCILIASNMEDKPYNALIETHYEYVYTRQEFKSIKKELAKKNRLVSPKSLRTKGMLLQDSIPTDKETLKTWFPKLKEFDNEEARKTALDQVEEKRQAKKEKKKKQRLKQSKTKVSVDKKSS